jgi:methionyl-tRNA formyltransferase
MGKNIGKCPNMEARIVFMGSPQFAVPILRPLLRSPYHVVAVYTQPDKPVGRSRRIAFPPVKRLAMEHGVPVIQPETLKAVEVLEELAGFKPELIVVAAFGHILPQEVLALPRFGCLNVHPSLLPRHRGPSPVATSILYGDQSTGVTIMLMDVGMDSGPILAQQKVGISSTDTTGSLTSKLANAGAELLMETLPRWLEGKLEPQPQDEAEATYSKLITSENGELDWHLSAAELWQRTRAYNPWPGCYTWWKSKRLKIHETIPLGEVATGDIGEVVALTESPEVGVVTGRGVLGLCQVQLEGKREMSVYDFVRGRRDFIGSILG